jgi:hypothetical protein
MISFNKILFAGALALAALAFDAGTASAQIHGANSQFTNNPRYPTLASYAFRGSVKPALPTYQAAPWYLYWPYDAHFLTPAPLNAPFVGPPISGNFPVNPYFPAQPGPFVMPGGGPPAPAGFGGGGLVVPRP